MSQNARNCFTFHTESTESVWHQSCVPHYMDLVVTRESHWSINPGSVSPQKSRRSTMSIRIQGFLSAVLVALIPLLGGCYTQLETTESAYDENVAAEYEDTAGTDVGVEEFDRDYPPPDYHVTFSYYHPGFAVGYTVYDPWDWYYSPYYYGGWYPPYYYYYPAYSCWPYYSTPYYPHPVVYYGGSGSGGYYSGNGGHAVDTRDFGNSRGYGGGIGTRGRGGVAPRTGDKDGDFVSASLSRPSRQGGATIATGSGGKKTDGSSRRAVVNRTPTRRSAPVQSSPPAGSTRGGSDRGSVSSSPKSSPPSSPGNSGSRGGSSGGSSRGSSPRSR